MTNIDYIQYKRWYFFLDKLDGRRFNLKDRFTIGDLSFLNKRKVFCESKACPLGYLPVIFNSWSWFDGVPLLKEHSTESAFKDAAFFFGLSEDQVNQIAIAKNYQATPTLTVVLRRMYSIAKSYGYSLNDK